MNILILSQVFWPDTASVSQHLTDLAEDLSARGHMVEVVSSRRDYENPRNVFRKKENYKGINISRIRNTGFGKASIVGRIFDFLTFYITLFLKLFTANNVKYDLVIGMTVPPLISLLGVVAAHRKSAEFLYWVMDIQPELSITTGYIKEGSITAKLLLKLGDYVYRKSDKVIVLDKYMENHVVKRGAPPDRTSIIPVWPVMKEVYSGGRLENPFRDENKLGDRIVVMYSGNHSVVHPLNTLLETIFNLRDDKRFVFVFIGGGVRKKDVTEFKLKNKLENILQFDYQRRDKIHISLSSADIHVIIQGNNCVGLTHPNKIYGAMCVCRPVLYIGPCSSHISDILEECHGNISVMHGEAERLMESLLVFAKTDEANRRKVGQNNMIYVKNKYTREKLVGEMINIIEKEG